MIFPPLDGSFLAAVMELCRNAKNKLLHKGIGPEILRPGPRSSVPVDGSNMGRMGQMRRMGIMGRLDPVSVLDAHTRPGNQRHGPALFDLRRRA
jgi:hypothetical protein